MKQIIAFLVFWISFLSCQSEEINIYTQHVKEVSKNKDGWNLVWSEEFEQESNIPNTKIWSLAAKEVSPWNRYMSESYDQAYVISLQFNNPGLSAAVQEYVRKLEE